MIADWRPYHEAFAQVFTDRRAALGLSLAELGRRAGLTTASLRGFQAGKQIPSGRSLVKLCVALKMTPAAMVEPWGPLMPRNGRR